MRRINQVLAGHLSFAEVARVHEQRDSFDALSAAPSHGSTVHYSPRESPLDDGDDAKINKEILSARQAALRHLVRQNLNCSATAVDHHRARRLGNPQTSGLYYINIKILRTGKRGAAWRCTEVDRGCLKSHAFIINHPVTCRAYNNRHSKTEPTTRIFEQIHTKRFSVDGMQLAALVRCFNGVAMTIIVEFTKYPLCRPGGSCCEGPHQKCLGLGLDSLLASTFKGAH